MSAPTTTAEMLREFAALELRIHIVPVLTPSGLSFVIEPNGKAGPTLPMTMLSEQVAILAESCAVAAAVFHAEHLATQKDIEF